jgi:hypothetical protein
MDEERRKGRPRHRTQKTASIRFRGDNAFHPDGVVECHIINQSPAGARLRVASQIGIPGDFVLYIDFDEIEVPCRVIWRTNTLLGVTFQDQAQSALRSVNTASVGTELFPPPIISERPLVCSEGSESAKPRWKVWA